MHFNKKKKKVKKVNSLMKFFCFQIVLYKNLMQFRVDLFFFVFNHVFYIK